MEGKAPQCTPLIHVHRKEKTDRLGVLLNVAKVPDPERWGQLFGTLTHILSNTFCQESGTFDPSPYKEKIREAFLEELEQPSPPGLGETVG